MSNNGNDMSEFGFWIFLSVGMICGTIIAVWSGK